MMLGLCPRAETHRYPYTLRIWSHDFRKRLSWRESFLKFLRFAAAASAGALLAACSGQGAGLPAQTASTNSGITENVAGRVQTPAEMHGWIPRYAVMQPKNIDFASLDAQRDATKTIGYYTGSV